MRSPPRELCLEEHQKNLVREQLAKSCSHFTGVGAKTCKVGICYRELVGGEEFGWVVRIPCITTEGTDHEHVVQCNKYDAMSDEEIDAAIVDMEEADCKITLFFEWFAPIRETAERGCVHEDTCPVCGKAIRYSLAVSNGHARVQCATEDCINFIE